MEILWWREATRQMMGSGGFGKACLFELSSSQKELLLYLRRVGVVKGKEGRTSRCKRMVCGLVAQWLCTRLSLRASLQDAYLVPEIRVAGGSNPSWAAFLFFKTIKKKEGIGYGGYLTLLFFQSSFGACFNRYPSKKMKAIFSRMARMPCLLVSM